MQHRFSGHNSIVRAVAFSSDGKRLVSASADKTLRTWRLNSPDPERSSVVLRGHERGVTHIAFAGEGRGMVSGNSDGQLRWHDDIDGGGAGAVARTRLPAAVKAVCLIDDAMGQIAAGTFDGSVYLWSPNEGDAPRLLGKAHSARITQIAASRDGSMLAAASADSQLSHWRIKSDDIAPMHRLGAHDAEVSSVLFVADAKGVATLLTASHDRTLRQWSTTGDGPLAGSPLITGRRPILAAFASPEGSWAAMGDEGGTIAFVRLPGIPENVPAPADIVGRTMITSLAISPDGRWIYSGDFQGVIRRFDLQAQTPSHPAQTLRGHETAVTSLSLSTDGRTLLSTSPDGTARVWDVSSSRPAATCIVLRGHQDAVFSGALRGDASIAVTGSDDGFLRRWPLEIDALLAHAKHVAGRDLGESERRSFLIEQLDGSSRP
jgi:WD40 repeat protein